MNRQRQWDSFIVVNGPEDGVQFPVVRTPLQAGRGAGCGVNITLDDYVEGVMAEISAVAGGYRIRRVGPGSVYVSQQPVGRLRSRVVRPGEGIQLGQTLLVLDTVPHGLASRSRDLASESDAAWILRRCARLAWRGVRAVERTLKSMLRGLLGSKLVLLGLLVAAYVFIAPFRRVVDHTFLRIYYWLIEGIINRIL